MTAVAAVVLAVVLAACGGGDDVEPIEQPADDGTAAPPDEEEPTPDEPDDGNESEDGDEPDDPFAVPEDIDEAYAQSVIDELFRLRTDAIRETLENDQMTEEAIALTRATHSTAARIEFADQLQAYAQPEAQDAFVTPTEMSDVTYDLVSVLRAEPSCIVLTGAPDLEGVAVEPGEPQWSVTALGRLDPVDDAGDVNPTPWVIYSGMLLTIDGEAASREEVEQATYEGLAGLIASPCEDGGSEG